MEMQFLDRLCVISAALRKTWDYGHPAQDGKKDSDSYCWYIHKKSGAYLLVTADSAKNTIELATVDVPRGEGKPGYHSFDFEKSKAVKRLVMALAERGIPIEREYMLTD